VVHAEGAAQQGRAVAVVYGEDGRPLVTVLEEGKA